MLNTVKSFFHQLTLRRSAGRSSDGPSEEEVRLSKISEQARSKNADLRTAESKTSAPLDDG